MCTGAGFVDVAVEERKSGRKRVVLVTGRR
jgi:hypothetical protein